MQDTGVGQQLYSRTLGCVDDDTMLLGALADLAGRDQQDLVRALQGGIPAGGLVVVSLANLNAESGDVLGFFYVAHGRDGGHGGIFQNHADFVSKALSFL